MDDFIAEYGTGLFMILLGCGVVGILASMYQLVLSVL